MHRNRSVNTHSFAMVPGTPIPRATFRRQTNYKTTFDAGYLIPVCVDEVLPGDTFRLKMTALCRMTTLLYPLMDNIWLDDFWFFCPSRILWDNWVRLQGQQDDPDSSVDFTVPQVVSPAGGFLPLSIYDYMGLPTALSGSNTISINALPLRAYNRIWNAFFRDQNLQDSVSRLVGNGPDSSNTYALLRRGKRHDYITSCLPWPQKGDPVSMPLGDQAPLVGTPRVSGIGKRNQVYGQDGLTVYQTGGSGTDTFVSGSQIDAGSNDTDWIVREDPSNAGFPDIRAQLTGEPGVYADLSTATAATIEDIRHALLMQVMLERDARGGTRYTEALQSRFGVRNPDSRLQRPEYLGGGSKPLNISQLPQTSTSDGSATPQGNLAGIGQGVFGSGFVQSFTEHGYIIGLVSVRADLNYQQGLRKLWSRRTRVDFYEPVWARLGEQAVLQQELYCTGVDADDTSVFGYQERWAEYRYFPTLITGQMRSTYDTPLDGWHLAQYFETAPELNDEFIVENPPIDRVVAVEEEAGGQHFLLDAAIDIATTRPMPLFSIPGLGLNL